VAIREESEIGDFFIFISVWMAVLPVGPFRVEAHQHVSRRNGRPIHSIIANETAILFKQTEVK
jgi:hypothetical protein